MAVLAEKHPDLVKSRLAYMCLIIQEARKRGGRGWLGYDTLFRQHAAVDSIEEGEHLADWSKLDASLYASRMAGLTTEGSLCLLCGDQITPCRTVLSSMSPSHPCHPRPNPAANLTPTRVNLALPRSQYQYAYSETKGTANESTAAIATHVPRAWATTFSCLGMRMFQCVQGLILPQGVKPTQRDANSSIPSPQT